MTVFAVVVMLNLYGPGLRARAQSWIAVDLHPPGASSSLLNDLDAGRQVGAAVFAGRTEAVVWSGSATSFTNLHPNNLIESSTANALLNGVPAGTITVIGSSQHAVKWPSTPSAYVELMPDNMAESAVWGAGGGQMCGWARGGPYIAGYWTTDDTSWVPLTAGNSMFTYATASGGGTQVGWRVDSYQSRATMWTGSSASWVNLQPSIASNLTSAAFGTDGVQQVGRVSNSLSATTTACVWTGSAASVVYLNPPGVTYAVAYDVCGGKQVGSYSSTSGATHACLWTGAAASLDDLHAALPADYSWSYATAIACVGNQSIVGGVAYNATLSRTEAVMWINVSCPVVTSQPIDASVCPDVPAVFSTAAIGNGSLSYAWQYLGAGGVWVDLADGPVAGVGIAAGAATTELTISGVANSTTNSLRCMISNGCGTDTASNAVTLTGRTPAQCCTRPWFVAEPFSAEQCQGGTVVLQSSAGGPSPISYRWQWEQNPGEWENLSNDTIASVGTISGASTSTMTISNVQVATTNSFRCRATNSCGSTTTEPVSISASAGVAISEDPSSQDVCQGTDAYFSISAGSPETITYQWRRDEVNLTNGADFDGVNTNTLIVLGVTEADTGSYDCVASSPHCGPLTSSPAILGVGGPACCPADFNADGAVTSQDFFDFITAFFAGAADFNHDDSTTSQDFFDFIMAFFGAC